MYKDTRLGRVEKWYHTPPEGANMRIPDELLNSVCFLCVKIQSGKNAGRFQYLGTGFFVGITQEVGYDFCYLVTAQHIIDEAKRGGYKTIFARLNKYDGSAAYIELAPLNKWASFIDSPIDIAVLPFAPNFTEFEVTLIPEEILVTKQDVVDRSIGEGDELFVVGLFTLHSGKKQNIPILRTGIISAMPYEPLLSKNGQLYSAYLAELRSIGGISGSPVFVYLHKRRIYDSKVQDGTWELLLLGLIRGHWDLTRELDSDAESISDDIPIGFNKGENLNTGIAVITPADYLARLLRSKGFEDMRKRSVRKMEQENQITED